MLIKNRDILHKNPLFNGVSHFLKICCFSLLLFAFISDVVVCLIEAPSVDYVFLDISQNDAQENEDLNEDLVDDFVLLSHFTTCFHSESLNENPVSLGFSLELSRRKIPTPPPDFLA